MKTDKDRAKDFLLVAGHVSCDIVDDCWGYEISFGVFGVNVLSSIKRERSSFLLGAVTKRYNSLFKISIAYWAEINSFFISSTDFE